GVHERPYGIGAGRRQIGGTLAQVDAAPPCREVIDGRLEVPVQLREPLVAAAKLGKLAVGVVDEQDAASRKRSRSLLVPCLDPFVGRRRKYELELVRAQLDGFAPEDREGAELWAGDLLEAAAQQLVDVEKRKVFGEEADVPRPLNPRHRRPASRPGRLRG